jgi:hypothetical protein
MKVDEAWRVLGQVNDWIRFADTKAGAVVAASGVLGGLLVKSAPSRNDFRTHTTYAVLLSLALASVAVGMLLALRVLTPKLRSGEPRSLVYFSHVAKKYPRTPSDFVERFKSMADDENQLAIQVLDQVWANSCVAYRKYRMVTWAIWFFRAALVIAGSSVLAHRIWGW